MAGASIRLAVSLQGENRIDVLDIDPELGQLHSVARLAADSKPGPLVQSADGLHLYAGLRGSNLLATWSLAETGAHPTPPNQVVALNSDPCYLSLDNQGSFLMAAYYGAGQVSVHRIASNGSLASEPACVRTTGLKAHCIREIGSSGRVLVSHTGDENAIHELKLDHETGELVPRTVSKAGNDPWIGPEGPRHFEFHPESNSLLVSNEHTSSVSRWLIDDSGHLDSCIETLPTLPNPWGTSNTCAQIRLTSNKRFLYVSNRGHNSLAMFGVDRQSGALHPLGWQMTEAVPRAFAIADNDRFLFCTGLNTGCMTVYEICAQSGTLQFRYRLNVGRVPMWVLPLNSVV